MNWLIPVAFVAAVIVLGGIWAFCELVADWWTVRKIRKTLQHREFQRDQYQQERAARTKELQRFTKLGGPTMTLPDVLPMLGLEGLILRSGSHASREAGVCAMEAAAWLAGEPHSDKPDCACPVIGAFLRNWNDSIPDDDTRTRLIRPLLPLVVGTRSTPAVELTRSYLALDWLARECVPAFLSLRDDLKAHAVALRGLPPLTDAASCQAAQETLDAARAAARAAARDAAGDAAGDAAWAAAGDATRDAAWDATWDAAWAAAGDAAGDATRHAAWDAARAAARDAAGAAAWDAAGDAAWDAAWAAAGDATRDAAWDAARAAAGDALQPTVVQLQISAGDLVRRMCAVTEVSA